MYSPTHESQILLPVWSTEILVVRLAGRSSAVKFSIVLLSESCGAGAVGKVHCPWCSPGRTMVLRSGTSGGLRAASRAVLGCRVHPATGAMVCVDFCGAAAGLRGGDRLLQGEARCVRSLPKSFSYGTTVLEY